MKPTIYDALNVLSLSLKEKESLLELKPHLENGIVTYTKDSRHRLSTTPGRFIKRSVQRLLDSEVKLFAEFCCKETSVVITSSLYEVEKAYRDVNSCMSSHRHLLPTYLDAGLALAISYLDDRIIGRMLINPVEKKCNTGYGNYVYLARHLLLNGYIFTENWLDGVAFTPTKIWPFMYLPYLDTPSKLRLVEGKFVVVGEGGEYEVQPKTFKVLVTKTLQELYAGRIIRN